MSAIPRSLFGAPRDKSTCIKLDLPRPVSVNRFTKKLGNRTPEVRQWIEQADRHLMAVRPRPQGIIGPYELGVTYPQAEFGRFDPDNCLKVLSDWLQHVRLIENDKWARRIVLEWGDVSAGQCRVSLKAWVAAP